MTSIFRRSVFNVSSPNIQINTSNLPPSGIFAPPPPPPPAISNIAYGNHSSSVDDLPVGFLIPGCNFPSFSSSASQTPSLRRHHTSTSRNFPELKNFSSIVDLFHSIPTPFLQTLDGVSTTKSALTATTTSALTATTMSALSATTTSTPTTTTTNTMLSSSFSKSASLNSFLELDISADKQKQETGHYLSQKPQQYQQQQQLQQHQPLQQHPPLPHHQRLQSLSLLPNPTSPTVFPIQPIPLEGVCDLEGGSKPRSHSNVSSKSHSSVSSRTFSREALFRSLKKGNEYNDI